jgi:galactokinase
MCHSFGTRGRTLESARVDALERSAILVAMSSQSVPPVESSAPEAPALLRAFAAHARRFEEVFGASPQRCRTFFAPGRVNLMGAHLDYNGGPVMPMAIDRGTFIAARRRADRKVRFRSTHDISPDDKRGGSHVSDGGIDFELDALPQRTSTWVDYPLGVVHVLLERASEPCGLDVLFGGNLPIGAGLSSSASICVGTAFALDSMWSAHLAASERVHAALRAEREFVGVRCGIMDPYAVGMARAGQLLWLDCKDATTAHYPLDHGAVSVAVADSGVRRELAQGAFNQRVAEAAEAFERLKPYSNGAICLRDVGREVLDAREGELEPAIARRARHVIDEVERTFAARTSLLAGDLRAFGARIFESHRSLRDLYEVSVPELDQLVDAAERSPSVYGARLTGAGFGGCVVILLRKHGREAVLDGIASAFEKRFGRRPAIEVFEGDAGPREIVQNTR